MINHKLLHVSLGYVTVYLWLNVQPHDLLIQALTTTLYLYPETMIDSLTLQWVTKWMCCSLTMTGHGSLSYTLIWYGLLQLLQRITNYFEIGARLPVMNYSCINETIIWLPPLTLQYELFRSNSIPLTLPRHRHTLTIVLRK